MLLIVLFFPVHLPVVQAGKRHTPNLRLSKIHSAQPCSPLHLEVKCVGQKSAHLEAMAGGHFFVSSDEAAELHARQSLLWIAGPLDTTLESWIAWVIFAHSGVAKHPFLTSMYLYIYMVWGLHVFFTKLLHRTLRPHQVKSAKNNFPSMIGIILWFANAAGCFEMLGFLLSQFWFPFQRLKNNEVFSWRFVYYYWSSPHKNHERSDIHKHNQANMCCCCCCCCW